MLVVTCCHCHFLQVLTTEAKTALIHKGSVNFSKEATTFPSPFFVFSEKVRTRMVSCKGTSSFDFDSFPQFDQSSHQSSQAPLWFPLCNSCSLAVAKLNFCLTVWSGWMAGSSSNWMLESQPWWQP